MKLFIIVKKELLDQVRDKRTMIAAVFLPALIVPLLLFLMTQTTSNADSKAPIRIVLREAATELQDKILASSADTRFLYAPAPDISIKNGEADVGIDIEKAEGRYRSLTIRYDASRGASTAAYVKIHGLLSALFTKSASATDEVRILAATARGDEESKTLLTLSVLLPIFLIIFAASSTISSVIDLSAGEKERGTIETLLSCNITRREIILGKTLASAGIGLASVLSLLLGLVIGSELYPRLTGGLSVLTSVGLGNTALMLLVALLSVLLFAALGIAIGLYAKSVKEGTILTLPVIILSSALSSGFIGGDPTSIDLYYYVIPILNLSCVIRSLIFGHVEAGGLLISTVTSLLYAGALLLLAERLLRKETVISRS